MKAKHTPGPWRQTAIPAGFNSPTIMFSGSYGVDLVDCTGTDAAPNPADVRLMVAAPDLAAALAALVAYSDEPGSCEEEGEALVAAARAALARAGL